MKTIEPTLDLNRRYSYADYLTWLDDKRRELIDGAIRMLFPAPRESHVRTSGKLHNRLFNYIDSNKGNCRVYYAPFDVRLPKNGECDDNDIYTVVQPDICVVCDLSKIDERGCLGAPDMIVEIISPSTRRYDYGVKYNLYERSGIKEYWVVEPEAKNVTVFTLHENGLYDDGTVYEKNAQIPVMCLPGLTIELQDLFELNT
ncbi:MAG: Uma2 family endonuclease [Tannerella sp.]|jgi:Uma2 family endonuclease|nr:Uma2 family endonuclease [Tannerella sp.]